DSQVFLPERRGLAAVDSPRPGPGHRLLIGDDERDIRFFARQGLQSEGIRCTEGGNGRGALAALKVAEYDLVRLDVDMPGPSGLQVLAQIRENAPGSSLKVIMMSGRITPDEIAKTLLAGADDCLSKPFSMVQLRSRVQAALRLKDAQDRSA